MIEENNTMVIRAIFSEDKSYRYLLSKEWDASLANATVIMLQARKSNEFIQDVRTGNIINCVSQLDGEYASVNIVNLFSRVDLELDTDIDIDDFTDEDDWSERKRKGNSQNVIIVDSVHEPISAQELWDRVQAIQNLKLEKPMKNYEGNYLLTGLMKCPFCGATMVGQEQTTS